MKFLCKVFGHVPESGYGYKRHSGQGYFKLELTEVDGLGVQHATLHTTCQRCDQNYQIGRIHVPVITDTRRRKVYQGSV